MLVKPGLRVAVEDALITLETDKATMDVPATSAGVIEQVLVKKGDRVSKGARIAFNGKDRKVDKGPFKLDNTIAGYWM